MQDLIIIDKRYPDCTSIDTEEWLSRVLGTEEDEMEGVDYSDWATSQQDNIKAAIEDIEGQA